MTYWAILDPVRERQRVVLSLMVRHGFLTQERGGRGPSP